MLYPRAIGFNAGLRGDLFMNMVAVRAFKQKYPYGDFTFAVGKPFEDMIPLFEKQEGIDSTHVWEGYEPWPTTADTHYLEYEDFDIVYNAFPQHKHGDWYNRVSCQTAEACIMNGLEPPIDLKIRLKKTWDDLKGYENCVALAVFPSFGKDYKSISLEKANKLADYIRSIGLIPLQIGAKGKEPEIKCDQVDKPYHEAIKIMLSCRFLICGDTGLCWGASGYDFPTIGLHGFNEGYHGLNNPQVYQPINPNAKYLLAKKPQDIPNEEIYKQIDKFAQENWKQVS